MAKKKKPIKNADTIGQPSEGTCRQENLWLIRICALTIVFAGCLAYSSSFGGVFVFDDTKAIVENESIRHIWPLSESMFSTHNVSRPVVGLSLALNYALGGLETWGYHAFNLLIHLLAGLTVFGLIRRTLRTPCLRERFGPVATGLAWAVAIIWVVHPLGTQAVTYVIQRSEIMMGLFLLLALYCAARGYDSPRQAVWHTAALFSCALGMGCKQVMIVAPILAFLHDSIFLSQSYNGALKKNWRLYSGMIATALIIPISLSYGLSMSVAGINTYTPWQYGLTQFGVILKYLSLSLWPNPLCLDYRWQVATTLREIIPGGLIVGSLLASTVWALFKSPAWGFVGAWFFLILAPTSSIMPIVDIAFEHRMYLPLIAVITALVFGGYWFIGGVRHLRVLSTVVLRACIVLVAVIAAGLAIVTYRRNTDYRSTLSIWSDTAQKQPQNARAVCCVGTALAKLHKYDEALEKFLEATRIEPKYEIPYPNIGAVYILKNRWDEAAEVLELALRLDPNCADAHNNMGNVMMHRGRMQEAISHFEEAIRINPTFNMARDNMKLALDYLKAHGSRSN